MKKFLLGPGGLLVGQDNVLSSKRLLGWVSFLLSVVVAFIGLLMDDIDTTYLITVFTTFIGASLASLGISSIDTRHYWKYSQNKGPVNQDYYEGELPEPPEGTPANLNL